MSTSTPRETRRELDMQSTKFKGEALRRRASQRRHDAEDQQPWRCVACGEAVSHIRRNDCACTRAPRTRTAYEASISKKLCFDEEYHAYHAAADDYQEAKAKLRAYLRS